MWRRLRDAFNNCCEGGYLRRKKSRKIAHKTKDYPLKAFPHLFQSRFTASPPFFQFLTFPSHNQNAWAELPTPSGASLCTFSWQCQPRGQKKGQKDPNQTIAPSDKGNSKGQYPAIWVKLQYGKKNALKSMEITKKLPLDFLLEELTCLLVHWIQVSFFNQLRPKKE